MLKSYQLQGVNWISRALSGDGGGGGGGGGCILGDEMGLGKTIQSVACLAHIKRSLKAQGAGCKMLVIAPLSVLDNWGTELQHAGDLKHVVYSGSKDEREALRELITGKPFKSSKPSKSDDDSASDGGSDWEAEHDDDDGDGDGGGDGDGDDGGGGGGGGGGVDTSSVASSSAAAATSSKATATTASASASASASAPSAAATHAQTDAEGDAVMGGGGSADDDDPAASAQQPTVVVTSYELVSRDLEFMASVGWSALVVDEAHRLKNSNSVLYKNLQSLKIPRTLLLTGTPIQNNLEELFSRSKPPLGNRESARGH